MAIRERIAARLRAWSARESRVLVALSLLVGVMTGLVVTAFLLLTGRLAARMYPPGSAAWRRILVPALGALVSGLLLARFFPDARGSGIPQTKFAIFIYDGYIGLRTVIGKFVCCSLSLASGVALGREGPSVQIGAGIASFLGRRFGLSSRGVRSLVPVGCSAALAAAFNTPIAAVLFSMEEILGDLHAPALGLLVIGSASAWTVLHLFLGDEPLFHVPAYKLVSPIEFGLYALLGLMGGLVSVAFVKLLLRLRIWFRTWPRWTVWLQPACGGLFAGLLAWFLPEVLGVGYDYVERVLGGDLAIRTVALLLLLKILATSVCYSSGNAGGIFGPSLFFGAMMGGLAGAAAHALLPGQTAGVGAYALIGMGTTFAGIVRTPITSVLMIFEMTRDYSIIVPLMISNMVSFLVSYRLQHEPIYEALAHQEGIFLPGGEAREQMGRLQVAGIMRPAGADADETFAAAGPDSPSVFPDQPLSLALEKMGMAGVNALPVVSRANHRSVQGLVTLSDILKGYGVQAAEESVS